MPCRLLKIEPFQLPLSPDQFAAALQSGHGRALMHANAHGVAGLEPQVIDACLRNRAYDPQCEGDRAAWMWEITEKARMELEVQRALLRALADPTPREYWDQHQLRRFALKLARHGHSEFRTALYASLSKATESADIHGCDEIIELDGADGLIFVAEQAGRWIAANKDLYIGPFPMQFYDEQHGDNIAERILTAAASDNEHIARYLQHVAADRIDDVPTGAPLGTINLDIISRLGPNKPGRYASMKDWSGARLIDDIETQDPEHNKNRFLYRRWGGDAAESELRSVAKELLQTVNPGRLYLYLWVFHRRGLPEFDVQLLSLANSGDDDVQWAAHQVLANHHHPAVRDYAWQQIRNGRMLTGVLSLLIKNYVPGDWNQIAGYLSLPDDAYDRHYLLQDLQGLYEVVEEPNAAMPHMLVYEHSPCSNCRERAVKSLIERGAAPGWLQEECRYDSAEDIRRLVQPLARDEK